MVNFQIVVDKFPICSQKRGILKRNFYINDRIPYRYEGSYDQSYVINLKLLMFSFKPEYEFAMTRCIIAEIHLKMQTVLSVTFS